MIGSTLNELNEPGVASVPDEVLMKDISLRRHEARALRGASDARFAEPASRRGRNIRFE